MTVAIYDEKRIRSIVKKYVRRSTVKNDNGHVEDRLEIGCLIDNHIDTSFDAILEKKGTSLVRTEEYLIYVLESLVVDVLTCSKCGSMECSVRDSDLCKIVDVMKD